MGRRGWRRIGVVWGAFVIGIGGLLIWVAIVRGPTDEELCAWVVRTNPEVRDVAVLRREVDVGTYWVSVHTAKGSEEWGVEWPAKWVWPGRGYFDD